MRLSELAELETIRAHAAASSPYHTQQDLLRWRRRSDAFAAELAQERQEVAG